MRLNYFFVLIILSLVITTLCQDDKYTYFIRFTVEQSRNSWQAYYCPDRYMLNRAIYAVGGFLNYEYVFCDINASTFQDYHNQVRWYTKDGKQNSSCPCKMEVYYGSKKVGPSCVDPTGVYLMTGLYHTGYEKNYTGQDFCNYIPDPPRPAPGPAPGPNPNPDTSQTNLGMILGFSAGGILTIGAIAILCVFRKKKTFNQQMYQRFNQQQQPQETHPINVSQNNQN